MHRQVYFITHPNVVISRDVPVPRWPLSELGRRRMHEGLSQPWIPDLSAVYCSDEQKAVDGAQILAVHLSLPITTIAELGENDRSATGFLPPDEFERVATEFFTHSTTSVRGWERAVDAQARVVAAVEQAIRDDQTSGAIAFVSHGAVGTLLYCHLAGHPIDRRWDQPPNGGGNYLQFNTGAARDCTWWRPFDGLPPHDGGPPHGGGP
ncbi:histidine phosphatase family protein [Piscinibacter terrae]|uniref:Histidine phosphatase family protein n=1 Tax=Piscinibacter terrae TaxID=2496871 RepID=A0A3N7IWJ7_9BURK|nr:histidine phosphatase family protein [Albitalea terrae]RQP23152.1 histidine phosphatase family protein [Albitalea terrae]